VHQQGKTLQISPQKNPRAALAGPEELVDLYPEHCSRAAFFMSADMAEQLLDSAREVSRESAERNFLSRSSRS